MVKESVNRAFESSLNEGLLFERRTRVASIFPNTASCLRLVSALLAECDEEWMTSKIYLNLQP
jgi:transposase-like protein